MWEYAFKELVKGMLEGASNHYNKKNIYVNEVGNLKREPLRQQIDRMEDKLSNLESRPATNYYSSSSDDDDDVEEDVKKLKKRMKKMEKRIDSIEKGLHVQMLMASGRTNEAKKLADQWVNEKKEEERRKEAEKVKEKTELEKLAEAIWRNKNGL